MVTREGYIKDLKNSVLSDSEVKLNLIESIKKQQTVVKRVTGKAVCSVAAKRVHKEHTGHYSKLSEQFKACESKELKISGRVVTQLQKNPTFMIQLTSL